jgi:hypothetical protein
LTGNIAFDTSETTSGKIYGYGLSINASSFSWTLRLEKAVRLSMSTLYDAKDHRISEASLAMSWEGLYTIGDILPPGLSEEVWSSFGWYETEPRSYNLTFGYIDVIGGDQPPNAELVYGRPSGEFANRWDLVDPDTLPWATSAALVYRAWSGEVLLDNTEGYITGVLLKSHGQLLSENYTPFVSGPLDEADANLIAFATDALEPGLHSLGHILPPGLDSAQFASSFTMARFLSRAGFDGASLDFTTDGIGLSFQFVPEPVSIVLVGQLALLLNMRRRRR